ncbi:MAG: acyl carrier protein [Gemmatimonadetes bacterium]|nr:acyl carrier protein [Gemmatimonadota bacterium]
MNEITPLPEMEIVDRTRSWVRENFLYMRTDWKLGGDDPMLGSGVIDSVGVIELVEFLQRTFGIDIADEEITETNLDSLNAVGRFVHQKCNARSGAERRPRQVA